MFTVIGAGMAGLLAAAMLREECEKIVEANPSLPNNHSALLRFRSSIVGDTLGVQFRKVQMMKSIVPAIGNPVGDAIAYSLKTNGTASLRSSISASGELVDRYIAPDNLIEVMDRKASCEKVFNEFYEPGDYSGKKIISTIPMPTLAGLLGYKFYKSQFENRAGTVITAIVPNANVYATLYFPDHKRPYYRASITGDKLIIEYSGDKTPNAMRDLFEVLYHFGMDHQSVMNTKEITLKEQRYAKILPIDEGERRRFIMWASDKFSIYSLGRFATWRPGLLMDDVVQDVRVIQQIVANGSYDHMKK